MTRSMLCLSLGELLCLNRMLLPKNQMFSKLEDQFYGGIFCWSSYWGWSYVDRIMERHWNDPSMMQRITRAFYKEKVFEDSTSDLPRLRWHPRNYFTDDVAFHQCPIAQMRDFNSKSNNNTRIVCHNDSDGRKNDLEHKKQVNMNTGPDVMEDPLDCVFGSMTAMEEIGNPSSSSTPTRRDRKRSHHRRRMQHRH